MEEFETSAFRSGHLQPNPWLRYVDDTFVVWPHGKDTLQDFLKYLNEQHSSIKFTMEVEEEGKISFLDVIGLISAYRANQPTLPSQVPIEEKQLWSSVLLKDTSVTAGIRTHILLLTPELESGKLDR